MAKHIEAAQQAHAEIAERGWTIIPDNDNLRATIWKGHAGEYISYHDAEAGGVVILSKEHMRRQVLV